MSYRTVLIENNRMMLERLSSVIRNSPGFELSARYQTAGDALGQMQAFSPNLILLDIDCEPNVSLLSDLKKNCGQALIICLSRRWDSEAQARLLRGGAQGYMIKPFTPDELQAAVRNADRASLRSSARVSQKVLTAQLRDMEGNGLLSRKVYAEVPPRVEYTLTDLGYSLKPILDAMRDWGEAYKAKQ